MYEEILGGRFFFPEYEKIEKVYRKEKKKHARHKLLIEKLRKKEKKKETSIFFAQRNKKERKEMSFEESLLDGFEVLKDKTACSIDGVKGLSEFYKNLGDVMKKFGEEIQSVCSKYKAKKINTIEGDVKAAVIATVTEIETTFSEPFNALSEELIKQSKETEGFIKEHEKSRKKMLSDAASLKKDMDAQIASMRKARDAYHKAAKEAVAAATAVQNGKGSQAKADSQDEKAKAADSKYREVLEATNAKQDTHYSAEQPELLRRFQSWEEERIEHIRSILVHFGNSARTADMLTKWDTLMRSVTSCAEDIDTPANIAAYAQLASAGLEPQNKPFDYEPSPDGGPTVGPAPAAHKSPSQPVASRSVASSGGGETRRAAPVPARQAAAPAVEEEEDGGDGEEAEGEWYRAVYSYTPANDGELEMKEGDMVFITEKDESGWWYASKDDKEGFVPADYVELAQ